MLQIWSFPVNLTPAEREFMTTKPNPPGHAEYMALAAKRYPGLPGGAQQNALNCLEMKGPKAAAAYAAHARARWPKRAFQFTMPKQNYCGPAWTAKDRREQKERLARYRRHMDGGTYAIAA